MVEQLIEAGILLGVGMSVVFSFLIMLIGGIKVIAWYARKFPSPVQAPSRSPHPSTNTSVTTIKPELISNDIVAAITAAIHTHRRKQP